MCQPLRREGESFELWLCRRCIEQSRYAPSHIIIIIRISNFLPLHNFLQGIIESREKVFFSSSSFHRLRICCDFKVQMYDSKLAKVGKIGKNWYETSAVWQHYRAFLLFFSSPFRTVLFQFTFGSPIPSHRLNANEVCKKKMQNENVLRPNGRAESWNMEKWRFRFEGTEKRTVNGTTSFRTTCFCFFFTSASTSIRYAFIWFPGHFSPSAGWSRRRPTWVKSKSPQVICSPKQ